MNTTIFREQLKFVKTIHVIDLLNIKNLFDKMNIFKF